MVRIASIIVTLFICCSCSTNHDKKIIDEDKLGIIDADVKSEETNLKEKAIYNDALPGNSAIIERAFENAPPMIPHTTEGFFPIKMDNNICLSCHMPDVAESVGAIPLSPTHFMNLRPQMVEVDGILTFMENDKVLIEELDSLNSAFYNCSQCHAPQTEIAISIENLFTPEFREEFGIEKSNLQSRLKEGVEE